MTPLPPSIPDCFIVTDFDQPYEVDLFPNSNSFHPTKAMAIGEELNNLFGTTRLIVKPIAPVVRKSTNQLVQWPNNTLYVWERDVTGWKK